MRHAPRFVSSLLYPSFAAAATALRRYCRSLSATTKKPASRAGLLLICLLFTYSTALVTLDDSLSPTLFYSNHAFSISK